MERIAWSRPWLWIGMVALASGCGSADGSRMSDFGDDGADDDDDDDYYAGDGDADADADTDGDRAERDPEEPEEAPEPPSCENPPTEPTTVFLSADDSNSQAAPAIVRQQIEAGGTVYGSLRLYEFLNYYHFDFVPAEEGTLRIVPQLREIDPETGARSLLVGVVAPSIDPARRRPVNLTFSVDTSGSMTGEPLDNARSVLHAVASQLREGDVVSLLSWDDRTSVLLDSLAVGGPDDEQLLDAIDDMPGGGSTNLDLGLETAYELAEDNYAQGRLNRVILISDGGANTGVTSEELIAQKADDAEREGIYLVGVGASTAGSYADQLMDTVTDLGKGSYVYVDSPEEAEAMFTGERLLANLEIAARDVRLSMTLPAGTLIEEFHGEEISENRDEVRPQHLAPNDAMLYHLLLRSCAEDGGNDSETFDFSVEWLDPASGEQRTAELTLSARDMLSGPDSQQWKADAIVAYATALTDVWIQPEPDRRSYLDSVHGLVSDVLEQRPNDPDLMEIQHLLDLYRDHF